MFKIRTFFHSVYAWTIYVKNAQQLYKTTGQFLHLQTSFYYLIALFTAHSLTPKKIEHIETQIQMFVLSIKNLNLPPAPPFIIKGKI